MGGVKGPRTTGDSRQEVILRGPLCFKEETPGLPLYKPDTLCSGYNSEGIKTLFCRKSQPVQNSVKLSEHLFRSKRTALVNENTCFDLHCT